MTKVAGRFLFGTMIARNSKKKKELTMVTPESTRIIRKRVSRKIGTRYNEIVAGNNGSDALTI